MEIIQQQAAAAAAAAFHLHANKSIKNANESESKGTEHTHTHTHKKSYCKSAAKKKGNRKNSQMIALFVLKEKANTWAVEKMHIENNFKFINQGENTEKKVKVL